MNRASARQVLRTSEHCLENWACFQRPADCSYQPHEGTFRETQTNACLAGSRAEVHDAVNTSCPEHFTNKPSLRVWDQLVRAADGTSNNLIEADAASSDADFLAKMGIALREAKESRGELAFATIILNIDDDWRGGRSAGAETNSNLNFQLNFKLETLNLKLPARVPTCRPPTALRVLALRPLLPRLRRCRVCGRDRSLSPAQCRGLVS